MIGDHGEVLVVDWGLSRMENLPDAGGATMTRVGAVMGTPAYMPPEQARGEVADPRTDVWALGAILYQICTNYPPYSGGTVEWTLQRARMGVVPPLDDRRLPEELVALCESLLRERPSERPSSGTEVARRMRRYLDGVEQRERALGLVQEARRLRQEAQRFRERALLEELAFKNEIAGIPPWADPREKEAAWGRETLAAEARAEEQRLREEAEALLEAALTHDPTLPEAREGLLTTALDLHRTATSTTANRMEREIRQHLSALPPSNPVRRHALRYLHGDGVLSLHTDPPGAEALLYRYELRHRRLSEVFIKSIGKTPILEFPLPHGSYMVRIRHPDREEVAYPVQIGRLEHWDGVPPGETTPLPIWLPERLSPTAIYVPAGWAEFGSAPSIAAVLPPHRRWVDGFLIERFPVTNAQYITMLDRLAAECREDLIQEMVPHLFAGKDEDRPVYGRNPEGRFFLQPDGEGDLWHPEWPVMMISLPSARRYAEQAGGRLPSEHEWEKAARGVDGRAYPWGNAFDPSFCLMRDSRPVREALAVVDSFPVDESPYGVRGMAGNVLDWTADPFQEEPPLEERVRPVPQVESRFWVGKGGAWQHRGPACIAAARYQIAPYQRRSDLGLRLVRDLPGTAFANR
jgi:serine/threonine-protein kinase